MTFNLKTGASCYRKVFFVCWFNLFQWIHVWRTTLTHVLYHSSVNPWDPLLRNNGPMSPGCAKFSLCTGQSQPKKVTVTYTQPWGSLWGRFCESSVTLSARLLYSTCDQNKHLLYWGCLQFVPGLPTKEPDLTLLHRTVRHIEYS